MIQAKGIEKSFGNLKVLKGIDFSAAKSEVVSIMGASGAGKSTLLQILGSLSSPDAGSLIIDGVDVAKLRGKALAEFRNRKVGFVFQFHHLYERLIPVLHFLALVFINLVLRDEILFYKVNVKLVCSYDILNLPHVKQIFGNVFFAFLLCYNHVNQPNLLILRSIGSLMILIRRPSTVISFSVTKVERVRIALEVVMFDKLAISSRAM